MMKSICLQYQVRHNTLQASAKGEFDKCVVSKVGSQCGRACDICKNAHLINVHTDLRDSTLWARTVVANGSAPAGRSRSSGPESALELLSGVRLRSRQGRQGTTGHNKAPSPTASRPSDALVL